MLDHVPSSTPFHTHAVVDSLKRTSSYPSRGAIAPAAVSPGISVWSVESGVVGRGVMAQAPAAVWGESMTSSTPIAPVRLLRVWITVGSSPIAGSAPISRAALVLARV